MPRVIIESRFNGPDGSANGGYACGAVAAFMPGITTVRLGAKPPLDTPLDVATTDDGVELRHGETVVARARPGVLALDDVPPPPALARARAAEPLYTGFKAHTFPRCFVCGPQRGEDDGLRLFPGRVEGRDLVACPWTPSAAFAEAAEVDPRFVWAALDCPSFYGLGIPYDRLYLLGEMTAELRAPLKPEQSYVVYGWGRHIEGRKHFAGAAIADASGTVLAHARHVWIEVRSA